MKQTDCLLIVLVVFIVISCEQQSEYERLVQKELERGIRYDSLFLGYTFGMDRKDFIGHSLELNRQQIITGHSQVVYELEKLSHPARMLFYPRFRNNHIYKMPVEVSYNAWAPWNEDLYSDSLIVEMVDLYEKIYGPGFIRATHPELNKEAWIKIDGNRRISIFREDESVARIEFLDLLAD